MKTYHILNGDALKEQFPVDHLPGEIIIARECLVEGPVQAKELEELLKLRAGFIDQTYAHSDYHKHVSPEFQKIAGLENGDVNLWFEEDLFCQVNLWFVCSLLYLKNIQVSLVIPKNSLRYGFGGLDKGELIPTFNERRTLTKINVNQFAILWFAYRGNDIERLLKLGVQMHADFPFVMKAIEAHFDRIPSEDKLGQPEQLVLDIMKEKSTRDFGVIFQEFNKRAPIYGYGDSQVKRIFDEIIKNASLL
ncbi:DUF1835 domain-containing protein [Ekhidna sp.]